VILIKRFILYHQDAQNAGSFLNGGQFFQTIVATKCVIAKGNKNESQ
jgi:hypothetical protein